MTEDKMVGWNHQFMSLSKLQERVKDKEARHAAGYGGRKELDTTTTQRLNNNNN